MGRWRYRVGREGDRRAQDWPFSKPRRLLVVLTVLFRWPDSQRGGRYHSNG